MIDTDKYEGHLIDKAVEDNSQDSAFAACLPLGLVMTKHIKIPAELRDNL